MRKYMLVILILLSSCFVNKKSIDSAEHGVINLKGENFSWLLYEKFNDFYFHHAIPGRADEDLFYPTFFSIRLPKGLDNLTPMVSSSSFVFKFKDEQFLLIYTGYSQNSFPSGGFHFSHETSQDSIFHLNSENNIADFITDDWLTDLRKRNLTKIFVKKINYSLDRKYVLIFKGNMYMVLYNIKPEFLPSFLESINSFKEIPPQKKCTCCGK